METADTSMWASTTCGKRVDASGTTAYVGADDEVLWLVPTQTVTTTAPATLTRKPYFPIIANSTPPVNLAPARVTYRFNGQQVAVREGVTLTFVHGDHIGSASLTTDISGTKVSELRYAPYGETRFSTGDTPTDRRFTGQRQDGSLYDFGARFFDPQIGRFISADSIVPQPGDPQSLNRYAYGLNNPLRYHDPTGHFTIGDFVWGVLSQWTESNREAIPVPVSADERRAVNSLAVDSSEYQAGRVVGALAASAQGIAEAVGGGGGIVGGVAACGTGVGCLIGAPDIVVSAGLVIHGTAVALSGANDLGIQLALFADRTPNQNNYRSKFEKVKPRPAGMQNPEVHHILPRALEQRFDDLGLGINIHDPQWQAWVEGTPPGRHQNFSWNYNHDWDRWLQRNPKATLQEVTDEATLLAHKYHIK